MANIKMQLYEIRAEIIKIYRLDMWEKYMEGEITLVLYILDDWMRKILIGGGIISGVTYFPNDTTSP